MAAAAGDTVDYVANAGVSRTAEVAPRSAVLGRQVHEQLPAVAAALKLDCVTAAPRARTVYTPAQRASVHLVDGNGECGWESTRGGVRSCVGQTRTPSVRAMKLIVIDSAIKHALGPRGTRDHSTTDVLSDDQLARGRSLCMTASVSGTGRDTTEPAVSGEMTYEWFCDSVQHLVSKDWLDVTWLALLAEGLGVNIMVWEPSGVGQEVRPYAAGCIKGLFLHEKEDKMDEAGDHWVHLIYRLAADPWAARAEVALVGGHAKHNHFDRLQLGGTAAESFISTIAEARQRHDETLAQAGVSCSSKSKGVAGVGAPDGSKNSSTKIDLQGGGKRSPAGAPAAKKRKAAAAVNPKEKAGTRTLKKKAATKAEPKSTLKGDSSTLKGDSSTDDEADFDADGSIGKGGTDHLKTKGAFAGLTREKNKLNSQSKKIKEGNCKEAYLRSSKRKTLAFNLLKKARRETHREEAKRLKEEKGTVTGNGKRKRYGKKSPKNKGKGKGPAEEEEAEEDEQEEGEEEDEDAEEEEGYFDEVEWSGEGIPGVVETEAYKKRHQRSKESRRSLSASAREKLPSLDDFMTEMDVKTGRISLAGLVDTTLDIVIPQEAIKLLVDKINGYVDLCTTEPLEGETDTRAPHQAKEKRSLGGTNLGETAFEEKHIYGMLGIMVTMGLTRKDRMRKHWSLSVHDDYVLVRKCMQHDTFELLYRRFIHCSNGSAPKRVLPDGELNPAYDSNGRMNHRRRVMDAKFEQCFTKAFQIFKKWVTLLKTEVECKMSKGDVDVMDCDAFEKAEKELTRLGKVERCVWDEEMATMLMSMCQVGSAGKGGKRARRKGSKPLWGSVKLKSGKRLCLRPDCGTRTDRGCSCSEHCVNEESGEKGVLMCKACFRDADSHAAAADAYWNNVVEDGQRNRKPFDWA